MLRLQVFPHGFLLMFLPLIFCWKLISFPELRQAALSSADTLPDLDWWAPGSEPVLCVLVGHGAQKVVPELWTDRKEKDTMPVLLGSFPPCGDRRAQVKHLKRQSWKYKQM